MWLSAAHWHDLSMPRRPRSISPNIPVHVVQRGNNRRSCFRNYRDYRAYLAALREASSGYGVSVHAYVLMTNHVHMLVTPARDVSVSRMMQQLGRKYVSYFNKAHGRTGTLWEGRFRSSVISSYRYLFACYRYIELNPVRAGLVECARDYEWSSYRFNAMGRASNLIEPRSEWLGLGTSGRQRSAKYSLMFSDVSNDYDDQIRIALKKGRALK